MNKAKAIEQEIAGIMVKMSSNKIVMPSGWSDDRQLGTAAISYKTYQGGNGYMNLDFTMNGTDYSINYRYGSIEIQEPLAKHLTPSKLLEVVMTIYQEATSPESLVEGEANLRTKIAKAKKEINSKKDELKLLEETLISDKEVIS